jgi:hypothetical protein
MAGACFGQSHAPASVCVLRLLISCACMAHVVAPFVAGCTPYCLLQRLCPAVAAQPLPEHDMPPALSLLCGPVAVCRQLLLACNNGCVLLWQHKSCVSMTCPCTVLCLLTRCRLPANIACDNGCVLQWHYYSMQSCVLQGCNPATCGDYARGRNVVYGSTPGWCGIASGQPEFFTNCAGALHCRLSFLCIPWCKGSLLHRECSLLVGDAAVVLVDMSACHLHLPLSDLYCQLKIVGQT